MQLVKAKNPEAVQFLKPHLDLFGDSLNQDQMAEVVRYWMTEERDSTLILMGFDGEELMGFIIVRDIVGQNHTLIDQAWTKPEMEDPWVTRAFFQVVMWSHDQGNNNIRFETQRSADAFARRWKFEEHSKIMRFDIPDDWEEQIMNRRIVTSKDNDNGKQRRNNKRVTAERSPEKRSDGNQEIPPGDTGRVEVSRHADR